MHDKPDFQRVLNGIWQHDDEFGRAPRNILLTAADADAGAQRRQLREIVVATEAEVVASQSLREVAGRTKRAVVAIKADDAVIWQVGQRARFAEARQIIAMGIKADA